jgi:hypothetical protein
MLKWKMRRLLAQIFADGDEEEEQDVEDAQNFRRWCGVFGKRLGFGGLLM